MNATDIKTMLEGFGMKGLTLATKKDNIYNFNYHSGSQELLDRQLGKPASTSDNKVAVYIVPSVAKIGYCPSKNLIRVIDLGDSTALHTDTSHLSNIKVSPKISNLFYKAQVEPEIRIGFIRKMWEYFNEEKFDSEMTPPPKFALLPANHKATGMFTFRGFASVKLELNERLFNAREEFTYEVMLHEMCHQANTTIDHNEDISQQGHGPNWQKWMVKIGLNPNRYDMADYVEYLSTAEKTAIAIKRKLQK